MDLILQSQSSECGLACLAMVASHHGQRTRLSELRQRFALSIKGASLGKLIDISRQLGMSARALRLDMADLDSLQTPCILHWDLNHFVVLAGTRRGKATIYDPAQGRILLDKAEVSKHFTGVALEIAPDAGFEPRKDAPSISMRQLTGRVTGLWAALGTILGLSLALQVFVALGPFFLQWVVDQVLVSADRDLLVVLGIGFALVVVSQVAIGLMRGWAVTYLSGRLGFQWMGNVFAHLLKLPMDFFEKRHLGDVVSRMGAVQAIQRTMTTSFVEALIDGLMALVTLAMMLVYSWKLALVTLAAVGLYLGIRTIAYRPMRRGTEQQLVAAAKQQSHLLESIRGMQSLKVTGTQALREAGYRNLMHDTINRDVWLARLGLGFSSASQLVFGIERIVVIWLGATLALSNALSVGMLIAYLAYKDQFAQRVGSLIDKWIEFRMLRLHGERLSEIVLAAPEADVSSPFELPLPEVSSLQVHGLSYRYADGEPEILEACSFEVKAGESLAIVGASGCGKTTLVKLLLGLLTPNAGKVSIGGHDIRRIGLHNYRRMVGAVMQDDRLFAGSIAENIALGEESIDFDQVEKAARLASIHDEISSMPMGYHSLIGDMGTSLSGGQKQRVLLARALYRQPRILFLDEATSHLDVRRERMVNAAVRELALTKIIIAHRRETIASADRVLMLRGGRLFENHPFQATTLHPAAMAVDA
jgi:ATP-binding cassette subfamily B protein RaxB